MSRPVVLFDLDGTLVDSAQAIAAALGALRVARGGRPVTAAEVRPLVSQGVGTLVATVLGAQADQPDTDSDTDIAAFRAALAAIPADPAMIWPGVLPALAAIGTRAQMAVVTNKPAALARRLLADIDLARHFALIVGGDSLARAKPDPAPLLHARAALGGGPALMIGDAAPDAEAAAAAGIGFVLFERGYGPDECADWPLFARFSRFETLPKLVRDWVAQGESPAFTPSPAIG